jgi:hypothetical protein
MVKVNGKPIRRRTGFWNFVKSSVLDKTDKNGKKKLPKPAHSLCEFATNIMNYKKNIKIYDKEFYVRDESLFLAANNNTTTSITTSNNNNNTTNTTSIKKKFFAWIDFEVLKEAISLTDSNEQTHTDELIKKREIAMFIIGKSLSNYLYYLPNYLSNSLSNPNYRYKQFNFIK